MLGEVRTNHARLTTKVDGESFLQWAAETIQPNAKEIGPVETPGLAEGPNQEEQQGQQEPRLELPEQASQPPSRIALLVEASRAGDQAAFGQLYKEFIGLVLKAVRDHLRDPDLVADAVQEAFARALQSLSKLRDPDRFKQWLLAIARHTAVDIRRDHSRYVYSEPEEDTPANPADDPADVTALREISGLVNGVVGGLGRRDAIALRLVALGFDVADVAVALGVSHGAAKVVLYRARRRLRAQLVLQLLASGTAAACQELSDIVDAQGVAAAGKHAEACEVCCTFARKAIYGG
jgi:RNA polymerase sigma factor (sigma-70 family)